MAWTRTWLAMVVVSAVFTRWLHHYGPALLLLPAATLAAAGLIAVTQRARTHRHVQGMHGQSGGAEPLAPLAMVVLTVLLGAAGVAFVLAA